MSNQYPINRISIAVTPASLHALALTHSPTMQLWARAPPQGWKNDQLSWNSNKHTEDNS